ACRALTDAPLRPPRAGEGIQQECAGGFVPKRSAVPSKAEALSFPPLAAVELEPVMNDLIAELARDRVLQFLDPPRMELDHVAGVDVDQVVVMLAAGLFEA